MAKIRSSFSLVFLLFPISGFTQQKTYITTNNVVYEVNLEACTAYELFTTGAVFYDIAYSPTTGKLYGMNDRYLFEIDLDRQDGNTIMEVPIANSLTCDSHGVFYSSYQGILYEIDIIARTVTLHPGALGYSDGDLTFYQDQLYLSTINHELEALKIDAEGVSIQGKFRMDDLDSLYGIFTLFKECQEEFYITSRNDIYKLDESLKPHLHCADIVNGVINGAATTTETFDNLIVDLGGQLILCENAISLEIDAETPFATYMWNNGTTRSTNMVYSEGTYWVDVTLGDCTKSDTVEVEFQSMPAIDLGEDLFLCEGQEHILEVQYNDVSIRWFNGMTGPNITVKDSGTYFVEITKAECTDIDTISIFYEYCPPNLEMPNVFTPNNDGKNDTLQPFYLENIKLMTTTIFDRVGEKVFQTNDPWINWAPIEVSSGVYFYFIEYFGVAGDKFNKKGWLQVLR